MECDSKSQRTSKYSVLAAEKAADGAGISLSEAEAMSDAGVYAKLFPDKARDREVYPDSD